MSTTIRISDATRDRIKAVSKITGKQMQSVVEEAVAEYERKIFWERTNERYAELRRNNEAWKRIEAEREGESGALRDGLD